MVSDPEIFYRVRVERDGKLWFIKYFPTAKAAEEYMQHNSKFGDEYPCGALKVHLYDNPESMVYELERVQLEETSILVKLLNVRFGKEGEDV